MTENKENEEKVKIRMAGFKVPRDRRKLIDRKEYTDENGKIDYKKLVKKVDELGERLMRESKILESLMDNVSMQHRVNQEKDMIRGKFHCIRSQ